MSTVADAPVPGLAPEVPVPPAAVIPVATIVPSARRLTARRVKDILVSIYAYGLLAFGVFFPLVLAAWAAFFKPGVQ